MFCISILVALDYAWIVQIWAPSARMDNRVLVGGGDVHIAYVWFGKEICKILAYCKDRPLWADSRTLVMITIINIYGGL